MRRYRLPRSLNIKVEKSGKGLFLVTAIQALAYGAGKTKMEAYCNFLEDLGQRLKTLDKCNRKGQEFMP